MKAEGREKHSLLSTSGRPGAESEYRTSKWHKEGSCQYFYPFSSDSLISDRFGILWPIADWMVSLQSSVIEFAISWIPTSNFVRFQTRHLSCLDGEQPVVLKVDFCRYFLCFTLLWQLWDVCLSTISSIFQWKRYETILLEDESSDTPSGRIVATVLKNWWCGTILSRGPTRTKGPEHCGLSSEDHANWKFLWSSRLAQQISQAWSTHIWLSCDPDRAHICENNYPGGESSTVVVSAATPTTSLPEALRALTSADCEWSVNALLGDLDPTHLQLVRIWLDAQARPLMIIMPTRHVGG